MARWHGTVRWRGERAGLHDRLHALVLLERALHWVCATSCELGSATGVIPDWNLHVADYYGYLATICAVLAILGHVVK